ncbi:MAG TPA: response regulator [Ramlibacter sp.]|uniref:response regulator n=1 Tax=Ramlibacter sp. TaxID=1917967 RepID=UPI002B7FD518|nr:response regulator [Ramlibacter sp.]HVZ43901.1 response regulator [Ramlibacter sp.]
MPARPLGALLLVVFAAWMASMASCVAAEPRLAVQQGVAHLDAAPASAIGLEGEWGFAWQRFVDPHAAVGPGAFAHVPASWLELPGASGEGYASYTLRIDCPRGAELALAVPAQRSAMRLYVNGALAASQGEPGTSAASTTAAIGPRAMLTRPFACPLNVVAHVANFSHRAGGLVRAPAVGPYDVLLAGIREKLFINTAVLGAYFVLGLLPVIFWFARRKDVTPLFFGVFCLAVATYADMTGERALLLMGGAETGWETYLRIEYVSWFASMGSFLLLLRQLFSREMPPLPMKVLMSACVAGLLAVLVTPARTYSHLATSGQVLTLAIVVLVTWVVVQAVRRGRSGARVLLGAMGFMLALVGVDALEYNLGTSMRSITPFGLLAFVAAPALVLARRLARALNAEELRVLEQRVKGDLLVRTTKAGIYDWDTTTNVTSYSERLKEILGHPPDADTAKWPLFYEFIHPDDRELVRGRFLQQVRECSVASGEMRHVPFEYRLVRADGQVVWVRAEAISLTGSDCRTLRYICSFIDITEARRLQERLAASRDEVALQARQLLAQNTALEENARLREDVERMSRHDLKTPLNSIIGATRLLQGDAALGAEQRELLGITERAGYRMLELVNLSLGLFKMETASYDFRPQAVNMQEVLRRVLQDMRSHAESNGVQLRLLADTRSPVYARAEEPLCYSLAANLVKNAVEATPSGGIVTLTLEAGQPLRLLVHNPGRVPPSVAARFFQKYVTAGKSGGTGLGTYSARLMARAQEGELEMSTGDEGTTLTLTLKSVAADALPRDATPAEREAAAQPAAAFAADHVLLVDDDEYTRLILRRYLPSPPLSIDTAVNGQAALEAFERRRPGFIVIDMEMPLMNGLEAIAEIRRRERDGPAKRCRIVMISSNDDPGSIARAMQAGADRYLTKPVTREALLATLLELQAGSAAQAPPGARADTADTSTSPAPIRTRAPAHSASDPVDVDPDLGPQVPAFLASRRELADAMVQALAGGDRERLRSLAHRAAGGLALYGFHWAAWQSREIETGALSGEAEGLQRGIDALARHLRDVRVRAAEPDPGG